MGPQDQSYRYQQQPVVAQELKPFVPDVVLLLLGDFVPDELEEGEEDGPGQDHNRGHQVSRAGCVEVQNEVAERVVDKRDVGPAEQPLEHRVDWLKLKIGLSALLQSHDEP